MTPIEQSGVGTQLAQVEGELTWLTYIIGTILGSHHPGSSCSESHQMIDAQASLGEFSD